MTPKIQILDYGSGNLFSIKNSIERTSKNSIRVKISSSFQKADALILPGVGSFSSAQRILNRNKGAILDALKDESMPLLGICLGMQLLFEKSEEGPGSGLECFRGKVVRFEKNGDTKVPHMGWNTFTLANKEMKNSRICKGLQHEPWAYFVHSFFPKPEDRSIVKAWTEYGKATFPAIIEKENIFGTQFHPEKSGAIGSKIISNFLNYVCREQK